MQLHLKIKEIPENVIITGDNSRINLIRDLITDLEQIGKNREYLTVKGYFKNKEIAICSVGIGSPSASIAIHEAKNAGAKQIIRVGSTGSLKLDLNTGDIIAPFAAVRDEGLTKKYIDIGFPAVPDMRLYRRLIENNHVKTGIVWTTDKFYLSPGEINKWKNLADSVEMECSALFTIGKILSLKTAALLVVDGNILQGKLKEKNENPIQFNKSMKKAFEIALNAFI